MPRTHKAYDLVISHSPKNSELAAEIAGDCRASGLEPYTQKLQTSADLSDELWEAISESHALLTIVSPTDSAQLLAILIGAASAWNLPIYAVVTDPDSPTWLPPGFPTANLFTTRRIPDVLHAIQTSVRELSDADRALLKRLYEKKGISPDQFALEPKRLESFAKQFRKQGGTRVPGERLLAELLRMLRQGELAGTRV